MSLFNKLNQNLIFSNLKSLAMDKEQTNSTTSQPKAPQYIIGQSVYQQPSFPQPFRVPIYERPILSIPHAHTHTIVYLPAHSPGKIPMEARINRQPTVNIEPNKNYPRYVVHKQVPICKVTENRAKTIFTSPEAPVWKVEQNKNQRILADLISENKRIKQDNQELKIQNIILLQKLEEISKRQQMIQKNYKGDEGNFQTDTDSIILNQQEYRLRKIKSHHAFKNMKKIDQDQRNYYGPCIVKCCDKCIRCIMQNRDDFSTKQRIYYDFSKEKERNNDYEQEIMLKSIRTAKSNESKFKKTQSTMANSKNEMIRTKRLKNQDVNELIKKLKAQNKILKRSTQYEQ